MLTSGIYTITNLVTSKIYVGYTDNFLRREDDHFRMLIGNRHHNRPLQNSFNKHGRENFEFEILEEYLDEGFILASMENYWANLLNVHDRKYGYNIRPTNPYGKAKNSEETNRKISNSLKRHIGYNTGRTLSEESRMKVSKGNTGKKRTGETKLKLSEINKGKPNLKNRKLNEEDLLLLLKDNYKISEIAVALNVHRTTITNWRKKLNLI